MWARNSGWLEYYLLLPTLSHTSDLKLDIMHQDTMIIMYYGGIYVPMHQVEPFDHTQLRSHIHVGHTRVVYMQPSLQEDEEAINT